MEKNRLFNYISNETGETWEKHVVNLKELEAEYKK